MADRRVLQKFLFSVTLAAAVFFVPAAETLAAAEGYWEQDEKKKYWLFAVGPDEYLCEQWIEYEGKEYYLDANGRMKTGWFTDKEDGNKYYLGEDGAKRYNCFSADDKFIGPEGTQIKTYDTYRKNLKKELKAFKKGNFAFLLEDFNGDEYRDLAVVSWEAAAGDVAGAAGQSMASYGFAGYDGASSVVPNQQVLLVAIWDPEDEKLITATEADPDSSQESWLSYDPVEEEYWLNVHDKETEAWMYFALEKGSTYFKQWQDFTTDSNEWGDTLYYINGYEEEEEVWRYELQQAAMAAGNSLNGRFLPLDEETVSHAVDCVPTEEELSLWTE